MQTEPGIFEERRGDNDDGRNCVRELDLLFLCRLLCISDPASPNHVLSCHFLFVLAGVAEDIFAIRVESEIPQTNGGHELLRGLELAVASEDGVDELGSSVLA